MSRRSRVERSRAGTRSRGYVNGRGCKQWARMREKVVNCVCAFPSRRVVHPTPPRLEQTLSLSAPSTSCFIWNQFPPSCLVPRGNTLLGAPQLQGNGAAVCTMERYGPQSRGQRRRQRGNHSTSTFILKCLQCIMNRTQLTFWFWCTLDRRAKAAEK